LTAPRQSLRDRPASADWRGWLSLAWVVWFGLLYGRTVVEQRGGKLRAAVSRLAGWSDAIAPVRR
jgi:hypothetical protein